MADQPESPDESGDTASLRWIGSSSNPPGGGFELARLPSGKIAVRNARYPSAIELVFTDSEFRAFLDGCRSSEFDSLIERLD